jgi:hypothetical protein
MLAKARRARKVHTCEDCRRVIGTGEVYLVHVASPDDYDLGNEHWCRMSECSTCARRYGRGDLIDAREATP